MKYNSNNLTPDNVDNAPKYLAMRVADNNADRSNYIYVYNVIKQLNS